MNIAIVVFPGSNCDHDVQHVYGRLLRQRTRLVWHRDRDLGKPDIVIIPGGFAHGDYLRTGALAKLSPIMREVTAFAAAGGPVLGICNGFQILCEAGLLPGVLLRNIDMKFLSRFVNLRVEATNTPFTRDFESGDVFSCPIAHGEGNFFAAPETLAELEGEGRVVFRYARADGSVDENDRASNPNGAAHAIAGICNRERNVVGLMPHPERSSEVLVGFLGGDTGKTVFRSSLATDQKAA